MAIEVSCPGCSRLLRIDEIHVGQQALCPACDEVFTVSQQNTDEGIASETDASASNPFAPSSAPVSWDESAAATEYQDVAPHRGTLILVMGLLSWFCCCGFGIVAWVMGSQDIKQMEAGRMDPNGLALTKAGYWIGIISLLLNLGMVAFWILMFAFSIRDEM